MPSDPTLTLPLSEQVTPSSTTVVTGISYDDNFAASNPGQLYLSITDSSGTLNAMDSSGAAPGSGTGAITLSASYTDITDILSSLSYTASPASGSDTLNFDIWDQAGIETTGTIPVTISSSTGGNETWTGAVSSDWNTPGNWSGNAVPTSGDSVSIPGGTPNDATLSNATLSGETITLSGSAAVSFTNVTLDSLVQASGSDSLQIGGTLTVGSHGTLDPEPNGTLIVNSATGSPVPIVNDGTIAAPAGSRLTFNNGGTVLPNTVSLRNNGVITANGGDLSLDFNPINGGALENVNNSGSITVTNAGSLVVNGTISGNDIAFNGMGALALQQPNSFAGGAAVSGFGSGDQIDLYVTARGQPLAFADGILSAGSGAAIPLAGSFGLGNFESEFIGGAYNPQVIAYAPDSGPSGIVQPDISAPASATVAQDATLSLGNVSISSLGTTSGTLSIDARSGTLFMNGASGSGTSRLSLGPTPPDQLNTDLASLTYVPAPGATGDTVSIEVAPPAPVSVTRAIPISITAAGGPTLNEPSSEAVSPNGSVAVSGSYADSFAQGNPGQLFLGICDQSGTLSATDASGNVVAGSGTSSIALSIDYVDLNTILASLHYTAGANQGSDTIQFDVWNQAGVETTGAAAVTIDPPSGSTMASVMLPSATDMASSFTAGTPTSGTLQPDPTATTAPAMFTFDQPAPALLVLPPTS